MATLVVAVFALLIARAFGSHLPGTCEPGDVFPSPGFGFGYNGGVGYGYGYGPCPPTGTASITLLNSTNAPTDRFQIGESGRAVLDNQQPSARYDIDFAQSPGVIINTGTPAQSTTDANGDATIPFTIPAAARVAAATLTFLPNPANSPSRTLSITIVAAQASPSPTAAPTATPFRTATPTAIAAPTAAPTTGGTGALPKTGTQVGSFLLTAVTLLALGAVLVLAQRKRKLVTVEEVIPLWFSGRRSPRDLHRGLAATRFAKRE